MTEGLGLNRVDACLEARTAVLPELYGADLLSDSESVCEGACAGASEGKSDVAEAN